MFEAGKINAHSLSGVAYCALLETLKAFDAKAAKTDDIEAAKEFETERLGYGSYVLGLEMTYVGGFASASSHFEVKESQKSPELFKYNMPMIIES